MVKRNTVQLFKVAGTFHVPQPQEKQRFSQLAGRHTESACYFLNGIAVKRANADCVRHNHRCSHPTIALTRPRIQTGTALALLVLDRYAAVWAASGIQKVRIHNVF